MLREFRLTLVSFLICLSVVGCYVERPNCITPKNIAEEEYKARVKMYKKALKEAESKLKMPQTEKSIVKVIGDNAGWIGSGFVVEHNEKQYLISATHVFLADSKFKLEKDKKRRRLNSVYRVQKNDASLAFLKDKEYSHPFSVDMKFIDNLPKRLKEGEKIACSSYGFTPKGLRKTQGHILDIYIDLTTMDQYIITSNPIVKGMSGGVLVDDKGRAVGVVSAHINGPDHWGMHLPISEIIKVAEKIKKETPSNHEVSF